MADQQIAVPFSEVGCVRCDMAKCVARAFGISRTEAKRKIEAGAVTLIEARAADRTIELEKRAELFEMLLVYSKETATYLRYGRQWKRLSFVGDN